MSLPTWRPCRLPTESARRATRPRRSGRQLSAVSLHLLTVISALLWLPTAIAADPSPHTAATATAPTLTATDRTLSNDTVTPAFTLSSLCPPSFQLDTAGGCRLVNRYTQYDSPHDAGVGGLRAGLPPLREGFTPQQIDLGRYLFFDPLLSGDGSVACSSCHDPVLGFSDGRARAVGVGGAQTQRSAPSLWNVGFLQRLTWDGGKRSLEEQMQGPLYSPVEMNTTPAGLLAALNDNSDYQALFVDAFGASPITLEQIYTALTAFESSLVSLNSRYDLYAHGIHEALSPEEIAGLNVFRSFVARCGECHTPPLFTNQQIAVLGVPELEGRPLDPGAAAAAYGDPSQRGGFRVPSLRNVARTAPYMHAGNFATLREAVAFYTGGRGHAVPKGEALKIHWHIWNPELSDAELDSLVVFLGALTDEGFRPQIPERLPSGLTPGRASQTRVAEAGNTADGD